MEEKKYYNQRIDCEVKNCKYCDCETCTCELAKIKICEQKEDCNCESDTCCGSFEARD